ncbi:hypothetical protein [uncultured Sanguibacteroides sp.]|nr:hypothetical protein [uncultured Sanguibacteroides sp.]
MEEHGLKIGMPVIDGVIVIEGEKWLYPFPPSIGFAYQYARL